MNFEGREIFKEFSIDRLIRMTLVLDNSLFFRKATFKNDKMRSHECPVATYPFAGERDEVWLTGALSKGGKCAELPPTFICGKRRKNRRKPVIKNIPSSGVLFTFEEGISTSHVCLKGQQPYF